MRFASLIKIDIMPLKRESMIKLQWNKYRITIYSDKIYIKDVFLVDQSMDLRISRARYPTAVIKHTETLKKRE